jgi:hypothetical protein
MKPIDFNTDREIELTKENQKLKQRLSEIAGKCLDFLTGSPVTDGECASTICDYPMNTDQAKSGKSTK